MQNYRSCCRAAHALSDQSFLPTETDLYYSKINDCRDVKVTVCINSSLYYCNSVQYGVDAVQLRKLQSVQIGAARIVTRKRKYDPITAIYRDDLH